MARIIYLVVNKLDNKKYIGQTNDFERRVRDHKRTHSSLLSRAMDKYGVENFCFDKIAVVEDYMADETEMKAISVYNTLCPAGYNLDSGGHSVKFLHEDTKEKLRIANIGHKHTDETRLKMSLSMTPERKIAIVQNFKDNPRSKEALERQGQKMKEKWADPDYKAKIVAKRKETMKDRPKRKLSPEHILKMKEARQGQPIWNKGLKMSEETKSKLSLALKGKVSWNKGKKLSKEHCEKLSMSHMGIKRGPYSEEHKKKISESNKGKTISRESRLKMSLSQMGRIPWNKGTKGKMKAWNKGLKMNDEYKLRLSIAHKGFKPSRESIEKRIKTMKDKKTNKKIIY